MKFPTRRSAALALPLLALVLAGPVAVEPADAAGFVSRSAPPEPACPP